jgi:hypothetical protein
MNQVATMPFTLRVPLAAVAAILSADFATAQRYPVPLDGPPLTEVQIREKYQTCPDGYYSGPQAGKARYTKDDYLWVVSPEFAARYCFPPEFIDPDLKGALAIAYKPVQEGAEHCGWGGRKEVCNRRTAHGFEIYLDARIKIEAASATQYNYRALYMLPMSKHLISRGRVVSNKQQRDWEASRPGVQAKFPTSGWGLDGVQGNRVVWPIAAFGEIQYIEELLPGVNYLSLEGSMGFFTNPRFEKLGVRKFVLAVKKPGDIRDAEEKLLDRDFAHVIHLPEWYVDRIRQIDKYGHQAFQQLIRRALPEIGATDNSSR